MRIDKGYEWNYWKLSYRRRFIRTLWLIPIVLLASLFICYNTKSIFIKVVIISILVIMGAIQLIYNNRKYQKENEVVNPK